MPCVQLSRGQSESEGDPDYPHSDLEMKLKALALVVLHPSVDALIDDHPCSYSEPQVQYRAAGRN
jgi:hypothetical protein